MEHTSVFVCGHRKSGTTLLLALLDDHPDMLVYPVDSAFFYRVFPVCRNDEEIERAVLQHCIRENLGSQAKNVGVADLFDIEATAAAFTRTYRSGPGGYAAALDALFAAFAQAHGRATPRRPVSAEKTTSTEIFAREIHGWYPRTKFIQVLRDPRDNLASLKSGWDAWYQFQESEVRGLYQSMIDRGLLGFSLANMNQAVIGEDNYLIVRYEDLVAQPEDTMRKIAEFIGVAYSETLLTPTTLGHIWPGNNFEGKRFTKVDSDNVHKWVDRLSEEEIALMEYHFGDVMAQHGYQRTMSEDSMVTAAGEHYKWLNFSGRRPTPSESA